MVMELLADGSGRGMPGSKDQGQPVPLTAMKALAASWYDETISAREKEQIVHRIRDAAADR
jgi:hypothetical protein